MLNQSQVPLYRLPNLTIMKKLILLSFAFLVSSAISNAQYNSCAGQSKVTETREEVVKDESTGKMKTVEVKTTVQSKDNFGNPKGNKYDLAVDGAFTGQTIVVLHFSAGGVFDFELPKAALKEKGFSVYRFISEAPSPEELEKALSKACQLWVISHGDQRLNDEHAEVISRFFYSGKGVYIWGDNDPYHADADFLTKKLLGVTMDGAYYGDKNVNFKSDSTASGMQADHLITTGLEYVYEGITIAKINDPQKVMKPLIWSSDGNVVSAIYEEQGLRLIIDGGFTRLYHSWDNAGTGRYVKNAAAWLVNYERFGEEVLSETIEK